VGEAVNPAQKLLRWFDTKHLADDVADVVSPFARLATVVANNAIGSEGTTAVRKLLEAKDCAVRDYIEGKDSQ
jgi:hypothetical protein